VLILVNVETYHITARPMSLCLAFPVTELIKSKPKIEGKGFALHEFILRDFPYVNTFPVAYEETRSDIKSGQEQREQRLPRVNDPPSKIIKKDHIVGGQSKRRERLISSLNPEIPFEYEFSAFPQPAD